VDVFSEDGAVFNATLIKNIFAFAATASTAPPPTTYARPKGATPYYVALVPAFVLGQTLGDTGGGQQLGFFGISILIAVGVALETMKQIDGQLMMRNYEGFLK